MHDPYTDLSELIEDCWRMLFRPTQDKNSTLRTPAVVTVGMNEKPQARTVVLRKVDKERRLLRFYSDFRAEKISDLQRNPELLWLFYDRKHQIQLRVRSQTEIHHQDELCRQIWDNTPVPQRKNYCTQVPPATPATEATNGLADDWQENTEAHFSNFTVIDSTAFSIDFLFLHPDLQHRARFDWQDERWSGMWIVP